MKDISLAGRLFVALALMIPVAASTVPLFMPGPKAHGGRNPDRMGPYEGYLTQEWILRGIAIVESGENDRAVGDDGISVGRMQINERYHAERAAKWGEYDPRDADDAIRIASCIIQENMTHFGDERLAVNAYNAGWNVTHAWPYYESVAEKGKNK